MSGTSPKSIDEIRDAFLRIHRVAIGTSERSYMSIPADRNRDADLILSDAIDELRRCRDALARIASSPVASNGMHDDSGETVAEVIKKAVTP